MPTPAPSLSPREIEVLEHLAQGLTYDSIARRLHLSPHTVETYLRRIRAKTGSANRTQLTLLGVALRSGAPVHAPEPALPGPGPGGWHGDTSPVAAGPGTIAPGPPDPAGAAGPAEFVRHLRQLKAWSGEPSLRQLERRTGLPRSTLSQTLDVRRTSLPPLERVLTIVRACGLPPRAAEHWKASWKRIRMLDCVPSAHAVRSEAGPQRPASRPGQG